MNVSYSSIFYSGILDGKRSLCITDLIGSGTFYKDATGYDMGSIYVLADSLYFHSIGDNILYRIVSNKCIPLGTYRVKITYTITIH